MPWRRVISTTSRSVLIAVAGIEHRAAGNAPHHRQILERHLGRTVLANRDAAVRTGELDVGERDAAHPHEVARAGEEAREGRGERDRAPRRQPHRRAHHDLLGDEVLVEAVRRDLLELVAEGRVLDVGVERNNPCIHLADGRQRRRPTLRGWRSNRPSCRPGPEPSSSRAAPLERSSNADPVSRGFGTSPDDLLLEFGDRAVGLVALLERLAVPAGLPLDRRRAPSPSAFAPAASSAALWSLALPQTPSAAPECRARRRRWRASRTHSSARRSRPCRGRTACPGSGRGR